MPYLKFALFISYFLAVGCASRPGADANVIVSEYQNEIDGARLCYSRALKEDPALSGFLTLKWRVDDQGQVSKAEIKRSNISSRDLESCLVSHLKSIRFTPAKRFSRAMVEYTLDFKKDYSLK